MTPSELPDIKPEPVVEQFMTAVPYSIDSRESLLKAQQIMDKHHIRHLPVMEDGHVVGILSDRDIKQACALRKETHFAELDVKTACVEKVYVVSPDTPLKKVALEMAKHRYGS